MTPALTAARIDEGKLISYLLATGEHPPQGLVPSHLQDIDHAAILSALIRLRDAGETVSLGAVAQRLIAIKGLTTSFGAEWAAYLDDCSRSHPTDDGVSELVWSRGGIFATSGACRSFHHHRFLPRRWPHCRRNSGRCCNG